MPLCSPAPGAAFAPESTCATSGPTRRRPPPRRSTECASRRQWPRSQRLCVNCRNLSSPPSTARASARDWRCVLRPISGSVLRKHLSTTPLSCAEMGMSYHLPRIVGTSVAADWMLTGRTVTATEADRRGLVSELVEPDRLAGRALELASLIADLAPLGVQLTKRALQINTDAACLASALELENRNQVISHATDDAAARRKKWSQ